MNGNTKLKVGEQAVTQEVFDRLPALLTAYQVRVVTGWDDHQLADEVRAGRIATWQRSVAREGCNGSYKKYLKWSVAKVIGLRM